MTAVATVEAETGEFVSDSTFFAPTTTDALEPLLGAYQHHRARISEVSAFMKGEAHNSVLHYFLEGNRTDDRGRISLESSARQLFDPEGAISALNAAYWSKALALTDVLDAMPQKRRDEWNEQIMKRETPEFEAATVRATIGDLLNMRAQFFAERVDGIFRALSHTHVTNAPEGFNRRMILSYVVSSYGSVDHSRAGIINDLRAVIAKFMGRDAPRWNSTSVVVDRARREHGKWLNLDAGALRIRVYKVGTAHLEVHPDMAYRLNQVLAHLYPLAIPAEFRTKPKSKPKAWVMMGRPLPFAVLELLSGMRQVRERLPGAWPERYRDVPMALQFHYGEGEKAARKQAEEVLRAIGGAPVSHYWQFPYNAGESIASIVATGCIPDQQAHQYYPTPTAVAQAAVELAQIAPDHTVLEPSAGQGGLADLLPKDRLTCVEIAPLHCQILRAKGFNVIEADFLLWADHHWPCGPRYDRIVMNPPFSEGRWKLHTELAASLLAPGGVLVAVLPASARGKRFLAGAMEWSPVLANQFDGTAVDVVLMKLTKQ